MKLKIKTTNTNHDILLDFWNYWKIKKVRENARKRNNSGPEQED